MSLSSSQIMGSRSAPRDQEDISGRRPVSVFHDRRQYRMAEDSDEEDRMPPRKESALSSKDKHYRTKAIHRSFASTPAAARASARSQVDDIVSGGDESDDNFRERLHKELDADRIARLREMNRQRLEALEQKLMDLHRQKNELGGHSDDEPAPSFFRHTKAYKPETYAEHRKKSALSDTGLTSDGGTTDDAADAPRPPRPPAHDERGAASGNESEGQDRAGGAGGYASDPGARKKKKKAGSQSKGPRVHISESHDTLEKLMRPPPPKRKRSTTKKEPFSFENRIPNPSTRALRLQVERMEAQEQERLQLQIAKRSYPRAKPPSTDMLLFQKLVRVGGLGGWMSKRVRDQKPHKVQELMKSAEERSEDLKKSLRDGTLFESRKELEEKPFQIWTRQQEEMKKELQAHKKAIATIKTELGHFGVPERRLHQISKMAWTATKTDFTEAEQEERRLLVLKVKSKRRLDDTERQRLDELNEERTKKLESRAFNEELRRRLEQELDQKRHKFCHVPVPKNVKESLAEEIQSKEKDRAFAREQRANHMRNSSSLPPNMMSQQNSIREKREDFNRKAQQDFEARHPYEPKPQNPERKWHVPDFQQLHKEFTTRKLLKMDEYKKSVKMGNLQPFYLRSEWTPLKKFKGSENKCKEQYEKCRVSSRVPESKLKKLGLTPDATQWDLIMKLAMRNGANTDDEEKMGLMEAERREYCIIAPSHFSISNAINEDIMILREERWPYTRGGRMKVIGAPQPSAAGAFADKPAMTKAQMLLIQHTARQKEEMEKKRVEEQERVEKAKKEREEFWGMKKKVQAALAHDVERHRQEAARRKKDYPKVPVGSSAPKPRSESAVHLKIRDDPSDSQKGLLLQRSIAKRLTAQAKELFRNHCKAIGCEDLADELERKQNS